MDMSMFDRWRISTAEKGGHVNKDAIIKYSMQLAMLKQLRSKGLISEREYILILNQLKKDYGVVSDI